MDKYVSNKALQWLPTANTKLAKKTVYFTNVVPQPILNPHETKRLKD